MELRVSGPFKGTNLQLDISSMSLTHIKYKKAASLSSVAAEHYLSTLSLAVNSLSMPKAHRNHSGDFSQAIISTFFPKTDTAKSFGASKIV